jgi:NAD-dependent dihydropyrimidine dehydrogenase PreA subunit
MKSEKKEDRGWIEVSVEECKGCGLCVIACPPGVMRMSEKLNSRGYHPVAYVGSGCTGCGICFFACPEPGALTIYTLAKTVGAAAASPAVAAQ